MEKAKQAISPQIISRIEELTRVVVEQNPSLRGASYFVKREIRSKYDQEGVEYLRKLELKLGKASKRTEFVSKVRPETDKLSRRKIRGKTTPKGKKIGKKALRYAALIVAVTLVGFGINQLATMQRENTDTIPPTTTEERQVSKNTLKGTSLDQIRVMYVKEYNQKYAKEIKTGKKQALSPQMVTIWKEGNILYALDQDPAKLNLDKEKVNFDNTIESCQAFLTEPTTEEKQGQDTVLHDYATLFYYAEQTRQDRFAELTFERLRDAKIANLEEKGIHIEPNDFKIAREKQPPVAAETLSDNEETR